MQYTEFGLRARAVMLQKRITLKALAKEIGVSCSYVSEIFRGTRPGKNYIEKISVILGLEEEK